MLKIIAAMLMLIDHIGMIFFPKHIAFRIIGRLAMPIFAYSIAVGFDKTKNFKQYLKRIGLFTIIAQIPYSLMMMTSLYDLGIQQVIQEYGIRGIFQYLNIGVTFFLALLVIDCYTKIKEEPSRPIYYIVLLLLMIISIFSHCDYGIYGVLMPLVFYIFYIKKQDILETTLVLGILPLLMITAGITSVIVQMPSVASICIIVHIKDRYIPKLKYFFYIFYPGHMILLLLLKTYFRY